MDNNINTLVLDTHYGVVRYLYNEIFKRTKSEINDLQSQTLFLKCITKYLLCKNGQYAQLYGLYTNFSKEAIREYFELNRIKMNSTSNEWLNFTTLISSPRIIPNTVDGPYIIDNLALRRYTHFWSPKYKFSSNILGLPFYCLDGVDHLYYEMIKWKGACENLHIHMNVRGKHIFHDIFYIVEFNAPLHVDTTKTTARNSLRNIRFLVWLDDVDIQTELYVVTNGGDLNDKDLIDDDNENIIESIDGGSGGGRDLCLLKRLYIACDNNLFFTQLSNVDRDITTTSVNDREHTTTNQSFLQLLNMFVNNLSANFVVTFDGKPPRNTKTAILNVTNDAHECGGDGGNVLNFTTISRLGFDINASEQIYEIEDLSQLNVLNIKTPNCLIFQEDIMASTQPSIKDMNYRLQEFLYMLSIGIMDRDIFTRMYMVSQDNDYLPNSMQRQLNIIYMQRYKRFCINQQQDIDFNPTFFDKTYVFSARNLVCTVKSIKYVVRDIIKTPALLPPIVMFIKHIGDSITWSRITQNIIYLKSIQSVFFVKGFTLQHLADYNIKNYNSASSSSRYLQTLNFGQHNNDFKTIQLVSERKMRNEISAIFHDIDINKLDTRTVSCSVDNIDLKCIQMNKGLSMELYYFAKNIKHVNEDIMEQFKGPFNRFMSSCHDKNTLGDKIYTIFMHLYNLYTNNLVL